MHSHAQELDGRASPLRDMGPYGTVDRMNVMIRHPLLVGARRHSGAAWERYAP
jgi:hypothetical protein